MVNKERTVLLPIRRTSYLTMLLVLNFLPISDSILIPFYAYLSSLGDFSPLIALMVIIMGSIMLLAKLEYFARLYPARSLLLSMLSGFKITEKDLKAADNLLEIHESS
ncbi:hypothetical protein PQ610_01550 [Tardisphaera miroshnichenkoae]